jgi:predicted GNAT family acetyltransferase
VRAALEHFAERGKTVIPTCPFAAAYIARHPELGRFVDPRLRQDAEAG